MGFSENMENSGFAASEKWVISALRSPLKPIFTKPVEKTDSEEEFSTTPTYAGSRIPTTLPCPPPPRKRKPVPAASRSCHYGGVREFFNPPDLETIFIRQVKGA
ncbi:hypothetical protein ACS0TY_009064 [Phlomoides rotata]